MLKRVRPLFIVRFNSAVLSGGNRRTYEVLRLGKSEGIDYVIITDNLSCNNATKMFPDYMHVLSNYKVFLDEPLKVTRKNPFLKQVFFLKNLFNLVSFASRLIQREPVDLVVGSEEPESLLASYCIGRRCRKPWTAVFQPTSDVLQPSSSIRSLNVVNILKFLSQKASTKQLSLVSRIGIAIELFIQLAIAERSLMLSVSSSIVEDFSYLDPKVKFHVINPGNGLRAEKFISERYSDREYDAIFFARLIPEKGLYDLVSIWKQVTSKAPRSTLAVAGVVENQRFVNIFMEMVKKNRLAQNIAFLGELNENALIRSIKSSKLTLYPSMVDSFSLVTLESLACGTPVVAYDIPAIRHNFGKCDAVLRCSIKNYQAMAEKVLLILENEILRASFAAKAKSYSSNYTWSNVVKAEKEAYFQVIEISKAC